MNKAHSLAVLRLVDQLRPFFAGKAPELQGAAIVELTSIWLAGHSENIREQLLELNNETIRGLTVINAQSLRGESPSQLQRLIDAADGYAVVMDAGAFVGIWRDREIAEKIVNRSPKAKGERIRPMVFTDSE